MHIQEMGSGPRVVFVHGGGLAGRAAWSEQGPLAARWRLVFSTRLGYEPSRPTPIEDFESDAPLIAELVGSGAHLVGHSYGGVGATLAALRQPERVHSLTLIETPLICIARGDPHVDVFEAQMKELFSARDTTDPETILRRMFGLIAPTWDIPEPLPAPLASAARRVRRLRGPWEAEIPAADLAAAPFPVVAISGEGRPVFTAIGDALADHAGAGHVVIPGAGHAVQMAGEAFNRVLEDSLLEGR
jgi:pimeloyl-ACP methyl ester carboxylesterase